MQVEQAEYVAEAIDWSFVRFNDNQLCLDLIDSKGVPAGILPILDETSSNMHMNGDAAFLDQVNRTWCTPLRHPNLLTPRFGSDQFGISHYAGEVYYNIAGFVEKNKNSTNLDVTQCLHKSTNPLLKLLMRDLLGTSANRLGLVSGRRLTEDSISKQFALSLRQLYETLDATEPHYIRCIKPNSLRLPDRLHSQQALVQLKNTGKPLSLQITAKFCLPLPILLVLRYAGDHPHPSRGVPIPCQA